MERLKKVLKVIGLIGTALALLALGAWTLIVYKSLFGIPLLVAGAWALLSTRIVGPTEMAIFVFLGVPTNVKKSGPCFVPFLLAELARRPTKTYIFDYGWTEVVTKAQKKEGEKEYGVQAIKALLIVYLNFPRDKRTKEELLLTKIDSEDKEGKDVPEGVELEEIIIKRKVGKETKKDIIEQEKTHPLIKTVRAEIPFSDEGLKEWIKGPAFEALRAAIGKFDWYGSAVGVEEVSKEADKIFKLPNRPLVANGFSRKGIKLVVAGIELPPKIKETLPIIDTKRLEAEAAPYESQQIAKETAGAAMEILCELTGMKREEVEREIKQRPEELVKRYNELWKQAWDIVHRRMAIDGGAYLDIRSQNPLQDLVALFKRMPMGSRVTTAPAIGEPPTEKKIEEMSTIEQESLIKKWAAEEEKELKKRKK